MFVAVVVAATTIIVIVGIGGIGGIVRRGRVFLEHRFGWQLHRSAFSFVVSEYVRMVFHAPSPSHRVRILHAPPPVDVVMAVSFLIVPPFRIVSVIPLPLLHIDITTAIGGSGSNSIVVVVVVVMIGGNGGRAVADATVPQR